MKYFNKATFASDPGNFELSIKKTRFLIPEIFSISERIRYLFRKLGMKSLIEALSEHLKYGDSQGAIVVSTEPLLIGTYNEDIDCVVMLQFSREVLERYQLQKRQQLICVNTFQAASELQQDLIPGKNYSGTWQAVHPVIADFMTDDTEKLIKRKNEIGDKGYEYIETLCEGYLKSKPEIFRNGKPFYAGQLL